MTDTPSLQAARDADYEQCRAAMRKWQREAEHRFALRDTFAAAALTGLIANGDYSVESTPLLAYRMADAMLCERVRNGSVAGCERLRRADAGYTDGISAGGKAKELDSSEPIADCDTDSPEPIAEAAKTNPTQPRNGTPEECSVPSEGSVPDSRIWNEPVAWWLKGCEYDTGCEYEYVSLVKESADEAAKEGGTVTPLYRSPTLTDAERALLEMLADHPVTHELMPNEVATLRGLLERTK